MQNKSAVLDIPIHDIKPLIEIQEYSFYYFIVLILLASIIFLGLSYLAFKYFKNKNKFNIRAHNLQLLKNIEFTTPKEDAYKITLYGATFKDDSDRHKNAYLSLVEDLESYKYKKNVANFSDETKHLVEIYMEMLDV